MALGEFGASMRCMDAASNSTPSRAVRTAPAALLKLCEVDERCSSRHRLERRGVLAFVPGARSAPAKSA